MLSLTPQNTLSCAFFAQCSSNNKGGYNKSKSGGKSARDSEWYTDSSAMSHMTHDASAVEQLVPYTSNDCVLVGNGNSIDISHIGFIKPLRSTSPLIMSNVLDY